VKRAIKISDLKVMSPGRQGRGGGGSIPEPAKGEGTVIELEHMDRHTFYTGLMLALSTLRDGFPTEGRKFHEAFRATIEYLQAERHEVAVEGIEWMQPDPVFGVVHEATEMVLEAKQDRIVALLNPQLREARFKISAKQAQKELRTLPKPEWFMDLAKRFDERLRV